MKRIQIERDPFARATLVRTVLPRTQRAACCNCGRDDARFCYAWESDGLYSAVRRGWSRAVCGIGCFRAYYASILGR